MRHSGLLPRWWVGSLVASVLLLWSLSCRAGWAVPLQLTCDRAPDTTSLDSLVASITRGCRTDDERAVAIYNYLRYALYHHAYPREPGGIGALKLIHVYGWSLCGGEHTVLAAMYERAGWPWRYRGWSSPGHTTVEASYGGRWHWLDVFLKFYCWRPDPTAAGGFTIASQEDIVADPGLLDAFTLDGARGVVYLRDSPLDWTAPAYLVCGDALSGVLSGVRSSRDAGSPRGWNAIKFDDPTYSPVPDLGPGMSLTLSWDRVDGGSAAPQAAPQHSCGDKNYRWCPVIGPLLEPYWAQRRAQSWSNGTFIFAPDLASERCLEAFSSLDNLSWRAGRLAPGDPNRPGVGVVDVSMPYPVVRTSTSPADGLVVEVSTDGTTWQPPGNGLVGSYAWKARFTLTRPQDSLSLQAIVQHNQRALPYLAPGRNVLTIGDDPVDLKRRRAVVSVAYCPGQRSRSLQALADRNEELGRGHGATWSAQPTIARAVVDRLPATMTIDVPTPPGAEPVYPRMLWIRREVLDQGDPASGDVHAPDSSVLAALPDPWRLGNRPPTPRPPGSTREVRLPFGIPGVVSADGQVLANGPLRWPKAPDEQVMAWAWMLGMPHGRLPDAQRIVSAYIEFEVTEAHDKADMTVGAVILGAPWQPGQAYPFPQLGAVAGTVVVKRADGPTPFVPPKVYRLDVTRATRALARNGGNGFALRIVPNRAIDDGWTVRFTPRADGSPLLAIEVLVDADE